MTSFITDSRDLVQATYFVFASNMEWTHVCSSQDTRRSKLKKESPRQDIIFPNAERQFFFYDWNLMMSFLSEKINYDYHLSVSEIKTRMRLWGQLQRRFRIMDGDVVDEIERTRSKVFQYDFIKFRYDELQVRWAFKVRLCTFQNVDETIDISNPSIVFEVWYTHWFLRRRTTNLWSFQSQIRLFTTDIGVYEYIVTRSHFSLMWYSFVLASKCLFSTSNLT